MSDPLTFEKAIDPWRRSTLANEFLGVIRDARRRGSEPSKERVLSGVVAEVEKRLTWIDRDMVRTLDRERKEELQEDRDFWNGLLQELQNPEESLWDYIGLRLCWDNMTGPEQEAIRRKSKTGNTVPMENREASDAQKQYLRALGYKGGDPENMARAGELINEYRTRKGIRR